MTLYSPDSCICCHKSSSQECTLCWSVRSSTFPCMNYLVVGIIFALTHSDIIYLLLYGSREEHKDSDQNTTTYGREEIIRSNSEKNKSKCKEARNSNVDSPSRWSLWTMSREFET